jgi:choline monooxygenase
MKPVLSPQYYFSPEILGRERARLFHRVWQFAGFTDDLTSDGDFITCEVGGHSVVIQNFNQKLRAFHNVCAHRFNRIRCSPQGNGPLRCEYHGWTYDSEGVPKVIPKRGSFGETFDPTDPGNCLLRWKLETCGHFVFVNRNWTSESLESFLGQTTYARLLQISDALGKRLSVFQKEVDANWKLSVENVLEGYHQPSVHAKTLQALETPITSFDFQGIHSTLRTVPSLETSRDQARQRKNQRIYDYCFQSRPLKEESFSHLALFPNFFVGASRGVTFYTHDVQPVSPTRSRLRVSIWITRITEQHSEPQQTAAQFFSMQASNLWETVFAEDYPILENVQRGIQETEKVGALSQEECRILAFQQNYLCFLDEGTSFPPMNS